MYKKRNIKNPNHPFTRFLKILIFAPIFSFKIEKGNPWSKLQYENLLIFYKLIVYPSQFIHDFRAIWEIIDKEMAAFLECQWNCLNFQDFADNKEI